MSTTPRETLSYQSPSLLYPRRGESSHVISDWGPCRMQRMESFAYPTSCVYTAPISDSQDSAVDRFSHSSVIVINPRSSMNQRNREPEHRHLLVFAVKACVFGKYCMQIKCTSKQKKSQFVRLSVLTAWHAWLYSVLLLLTGIVIYKRGRTYGDWNISQESSCEFWKSGYNTRRFRVWEEVGCCCCFFPPFLCVITLFVYEPPQHFHIFAIDRQTWQLFINIFSYQNPAAYHVPAVYWRLLRYDC